MDESNDYLADIGYDLRDLPDDWLANFSPRLTEYTDNINPSDDVDDYVPLAGVRIERMGEDGIWMAALTDDDLPDIHYHISCTDDGLSVRRRVEPSRDKS